MTLTPALSRRERGPTEVSGVLHRPESDVSIMDSQLNVQVGASLEHPRTGPLSLWERVRVRGRLRCLPLCIDLKERCRLLIHS